MTDYAASRVPAVLDWLLANLPDITGVQVIEGAPGQNAKDERIEIVGATAAQEYRAGSARTPGGPLGTETATIDLLIGSVKKGKDSTTVRQRVYAIADLFNTWLRSNPRSTLSFGGLVCWGQMVPVELVYSTGDNARGAHLHVELTFTDANAGRRTPR